MVTKPSESNVSSETWAKYLGLVSQTKRTVEEANGAHRATLKKAKADGCSPKALLAAIAAKRLDEEVVAQDLRDYVRALHVARIPVSADTIYGGWTPPPKEEEDVFGANDAGYRAGKGGTPASENPYQPGTESHQAWAKSWHDGQAALVMESPSGTRAADATRKRPERKGSARAEEASNQTTRTAGRKGSAAGRKGGATADPAVH